MKIFYNSSLPRAGSSLLQNILGQDPNIFVTPTSGLLELVYAARANFTDSPEFKAQDSETMSKAFLGFCKDGMDGYYKRITDKPYIVDKSRGWGIHYNLLKEIRGEEPKVVCMVRDLRAVYASMEKNFRKGFLYNNSVVNHANMTGTTTPKRIDIWAQSQPVGLAIERLQEMILQGIADKVHFIKFEDLCKNPALEIEKLYKYLDLPNYVHDFNNVEQITVEDDEVYGVFGDHKIRTKVEPVTMDYVKILGVQPSNWIFDNYKWFYDRFNYKR